MTDYNSNRLQYGFFRLQLRGVHRSHKTIRSRLREDFAVTALHKRTGRRQACASSFSMVIQCMSEVLEPLFTRMSIFLATLVLMQGALRFLNLVFSNS